MGSSIGRAPPEREEIGFKSRLNYPVPRLPADFGGVLVSTCEVEQTARVVDVSLATLNTEAQDQMPKTTM